MEPEQVPDLRTPADHRDLAADPASGGDVLRRLAGSPYPFVWQALAANPVTPSDVLHRLCDQTDSIWNDNRLLAQIAAHPNADRPVLLLVLRELASRLETAGNRPYAAALALAERTELTPEEVRPLAALPGASQRFRRGLAARLAQRNRSPEPLGGNGSR